MTVLSKLQTCAATIEALIFASDRPLRERELKLHLPDGVAFGEVIAIIATRYDETSGIELCQVADSWAFRTKVEISEQFTQRKKVERPLSRAALEVLAIIAYHQPLTRAGIEEIRGTSLSKGTVDILLELEWIKPVGRRRTPGKPLTWGTTTAFLDHFGLASVTALPGIDELRSAGLLRKGQVLGAVMDQSSQTDAIEDEAVSLGEELLDEVIGEDDNAPV